MSKVRDSARVTVREPVRGMRRGRGPGKPKVPLESHVDPRTVHPAVIEAALAIWQPGQRLVIVSATEVRLVNRR